MERAHVRQARFLHHPPGGDVDDHGLRDHAAHAELGEAFLDQGSRTFGSVALAPGGSLEPVAELGLVLVSAFPRPEVEPSEKFPGGLLDGRPETVPVTLLVIAEEGRQNVVFDLLARRRPATRYEVHYLRVTVEFEQILRVSHREPAKNKPLGFQKDPQRAILLAPATTEPIRPA